MSPDEGSDGSEPELLPQSPPAPPLADQYAGCRRGHYHKLRLGEQAILCPKCGQPEYTTDATGKLVQPRISV